MNIITQRHTSAGRRKKNEEEYQQNRNKNRFHSTLQLEKYIR